MNLQAEGKAQEPYASFDQAADRIERRLRRYNKRLKERHASANGGPEAGDAARPMVANYLIEAPDEEAEEVQDFSPVIVAEGIGAAQEAVRRLRGRRTRSYGRAGRRFSACGKRARERGLPARRWRDRLDRPALSAAAPKMQGEGCLFRKE